VNIDDFLGSVMWYIGCIPIYMCVCVHVYVRVYVCIH
jgi:hypothetical protein